MIFTVELKDKPQMTVKVDGGYYMEAGAISFYDKPQKVYLIVAAGAWSFMHGPDEPHKPDEHEVETP